MEKKEIEVEVDYETCGFCTEYDCDECYCMARGDKEIYPEDCCDGWEDEAELTDEEKREIIGDRKAHEIMEQEGHIA